MAFQKRVRPPTEERRVSNAALWESRSAPASANNSNNNNLTARISNIDLCLFL